MSNFSGQPVKHDIRTYDNIRKITTGRGDKGCLLDYSYVKELYKLIAIDLSKEPLLNANLKAIQQINFTGNLD